MNTNVSYAKFLFSVWCAVAVFLFSSCSVGLTVQQELLQKINKAAELQYSIVCVIHGDGNYLYHDASGKEYNADEETLIKIRTVAEQNPYAEVFIYHQKAKKGFLFFTFDDGEFYYYRNGQFVANESYQRDQHQSRFNSEVGLYDRFRAVQNGTMKNIFLYFGHEIPEFGGKRYNVSMPERTFIVQDIAEGVKNFTERLKKFDLMILSTCFGGTPYTIGTLAPFARYIIASPDNLHLSYFDLSPLQRLDLGLQGDDVSLYANKFAHNAFNRLSNTIETSVTVVVYDVVRAQEFLDVVRENYIQTINTIDESQHAPGFGVEHCDCGDISALVIPAMKEGVEIFYRPARFGRTKDKLSHSGWTCWNAF